LGIVRKDRNPDRGVFEYGAGFQRFRVFVQVAELKLQPGTGVDPGIELEFEDAGKEGGPPVNVVDEMPRRIILLLNDVIIVC
jgi:hypothetical protein